MSFDGVSRWFGAGLGSQRSLRLSSVILRCLRVRAGCDQLRLGAEGRLGSIDDDLTGANFMTALVVLRARLVGAAGFVHGRAPATSGRFRRKWAPISPWSWTSVRFSAGDVRCRLRRPGEMPAPRGVSGRFGLRNRPEVASGVRESLGERGGTVVVDELDAKLRPKLLRYVILLFKDSEVNKNGAQLIFSSQDVSAMRNDVFRRDEIWFAARAEGEASQLWSLADTQPWRMRSV